ncbi:MAG: DUF302 domain-containing protein [Chloroflexota bacterium]
MTRTANDYGLRTHLNLPYEQTVEKVTAALKDEGFGVLTEIDVKATLKKKLDVGFRKYIILGACNPPLAYRAFQSELEVGLLLPCNVIVYEDEVEGGSVVSIVDPLAMLGVVANAGLTPIANEARARLERVLAALG